MGLSQILMLVIGAPALTGVLVYLIYRVKSVGYVQANAGLNQHIATLRAELLVVQTRLGDSEVARITAETKAERLPELEKTLGQSGQAHSSAISKIAELETQLASERKHTEEKIVLLNEARDQLKIEFQNLAQQILEEKSVKFTKQNQDNLGNLLNPLREQLDGFKQRINETYEKDSNGRLKLLHEIETLKNLNLKISDDAINLTNALRGESKTQGNWGEVVLEKLLEQSGLRKGYEYQTQESYRNNDGKRLIPDVVIHLPDGKDIVVDSKVSLTAYDDYSSAKTEEEKKQAMKRLVTSVRAHVKGLRSKNYDDLEGVRTLDYVLMFVPVESAYITAVEHDNTLYQETMDHHIMVVSPSTLMIALKTIHNIWRYEHQNENAMEIARRAGELYDKFVGFTQSLTEIGARLDQAQEAYGKAHNQLARGKGNLVNRIETIKILGAKTKKAISGNLLEDARDDKAQVLI